MSLTLGLNNAVSGLVAAQRNIDAIANNIANVNTKGYTRKTLDQEAVVSGGVRTGVVQRQVDDALYRDIIREQAALGELTVSRQYYERLQDLFGQPGSNTSISHTIAAFDEAAATLAAQPTDTALQWTLTHRADNVATQLGQLAEQIQNMRLEADRAIDQTVDTINDILSNIGDLNEQVARNQLAGRDVAALEDQRDTNLVELANYMDFQQYRNDDGRVMLYTTSGRTLVNVASQELDYQGAAASQAWMAKAADDFQPITLNGNDITADITSGELKALIDLRDAILPDLQAEIDNLAAQMKEEVNKVHNRGTSFPTQATSYTGTRSFAAPAAQTVTFNGTDDVMMTVFDSDGAEVASTTVRTLVGAGPVSIDALATGIETWLIGQGYATATAGVDADGHLAIDLDDTSVSLAFRDQDATARGSAAGDASISFDADGDGTDDSTVEGFSYFFGLNDFYVDGLAEVVHDSGIKSANWQASAAGTLDLGSGGAALGMVNVGVGDTLDDIADAINALGLDIEAAVVPEGSGYRLRIRYLDADDLVVTGTATAALGMAVSTAGLAGSMEVREDLLSTPAKIGRGAVQYDSDKDSYFLGEGDNTTALALSQAMTTKRLIPQAGGIGAANHTFSSYAASIVSTQASVAAATKDRHEFQEVFSQQLEFRRASMSGVNLDEEMSNLIIYQQAYAASAKIITTTQELFEILNGIV